MRTTLHLSLSLVCNQRRFQFPNCFSSLSALLLFLTTSFSGSLFSRASFDLTLHNFLLNGQCLYNTHKLVLGSGSHLSQEQVVGIWASPSMACQSNHSSHLPYYSSLLPILIFRLLATAWVIALTKNLGSKC